MSYINLHTHTEYSNIRMIDSTNKLTKVIDKAIELGMNGIAITDHESLSGHVKAINHLAGLKEKNVDNPTIQKFKLILGNEIYLVRDGLNQCNYVKDEDYFYHFILLAKDKIGHEQLREISSCAWSRSFRQFIERVPTYYSDIERIIGSNPGHIIASTACLGSEFAKRLMRFVNNGKQKDDLDRLDTFINWCKKIFNDDFYIELQVSDSDDQHEYNQIAISYAKAKGINMIVTTDVHYLTKDDRKVHKAYLNSGDGDREVDEFYSGTYLMKAEEIVEGLSGYLEPKDVKAILDNTNIIGNKVQEYSLKQKQVVPRIQLGDLPKVSQYMQACALPYPQMRKFYNSDDIQDKYYVLDILKGLEEKINESEWIKYFERIEKELEEVWLISEKIDDRLSAYFNTMKKVINIMWNEVDSIVGISRGSAAGFVSNYLLDITQLDPLIWGIELPYWRFIHRDRPELPDIDTDFQSSKRSKFIEELKAYFKNIGGNAFNIATFGTETAKAAIQTAVRGLDYDNDIGTYISSAIPVDRGKVRTLNECMFGDESKDWKPIGQFVSAMKQYPDVWEVARGIEGLICRRGLHACGVVPFIGELTNYNAGMKAPNKLECTQYELYDSEEMGLVKFDGLTTDALDRIRITMDLLLKYGYMDWKGSLKATYDYYLSPSNLVLDNDEMWSMVAENKIGNLFQYDTVVGLTAARRIRPKNPIELSAGNSLMRLMAEQGQEMPLDVYVKFKDDISLWYKELENHGLSPEEIKILEKHLLPLSGVADSQESIMLLSMDPKIANFSVKYANKLRKTIAKKKLADIAEVHELFLSAGRESGASDNLLNYVWNVQIGRQLGYSFSVLHSFAYSLIAIQEMNLATRFPIIFWNTANLIVDSQGIDEGDSFETYIDNIDEREIEEEEETEEEEEVKDKKKTKVIKYGKIASAIGKMKSMGIEIGLPDINESGFTFTPNVEKNKILFGIKGITRINDDIAKAIIENRPYKSLQAFMNKVKLAKLPMINLIKSGAFDELENKPRHEIMNWYINLISDTKSRLTLQNMQMLIRENVLGEEYDFERRVFNFNKYLKKLKSNEEYYTLDDKALAFYEKHFNMDNIVSEDKSFMILIKTWEKIYKANMEQIKSDLKTKSEILEKLNSTLTAGVWNKYASGTISKWEMDSVSFYFNEHELTLLNKDKYDVKNFSICSEEPEVDKTWFTKDGKEIAIFKLFRIAGTVIHKDKNKNIVTLLTEDGVVDMKIYKTQFAKYDRQISIKDESTGKKKVIEKSWFTRGNKIMVAGIRRDNFFIPKVYKNCKFDYPIELIKAIDAEGNLLLHGERANNV